MSALRLRYALVVVAVIISSVLALAAVAPAVPVAPTLPDALDCNGVLIAPLGPLAEALGGSALFTADNIQVSLPKGNNILVNPNGKPEANNENDVTDKLKPFTCGETVYVQLQPFIESLGGKFEKNAAKKIARLTLPGIEKPVEILIVTETATTEQFAENGVELYIVNPTNRIQRRLSYGDASGMQCSLSSDGMRLAYVRGGSLYLREMTSGIPRLLLKASAETSTYYSTPNITPDGNAIYCARHTFDPMMTVQTTDIIRVGTDGVEQHCWTDTGLPHLSPDGKMLVYTKLDEKLGERVICGLDPKAPEDAKPLNFGIGYHPVFSPDGTSIVFTRPYKNAKGEKAWTLVTGEMTGEHAGASHELAPERQVGNQVAGSYSPDGQFIVYEERGKGIFITRANLEGVRQVTSKTGDTLPYFSPDGKSVYFVRNGNIYITNAEGAGTDKFLSSNVVVTDYLPHGNAILFVGRQLMANDAPDQVFPPAPDDFPPIVMTVPVKPTPVKPATTAPPKTK